MGYCLLWTAAGGGGGMSRFQAEHLWDGRPPVLRVNAVNRQVGLSFHLVSQGRRNAELKVERTRGSCLFQQRLRPRAFV